MKSAPVVAKSTIVQYLVPLAATLLVACSEDGDTSSGRERLDGNADSGSGGTGGSGSVPEASPDSNDASSYPIDPNGPPPDCILPCVWEVMKRCPGPEPGQGCVHDGLSQVNCCPMDQPAPDGPVVCDDVSWVQVGNLSRRVYEDGDLCWRLSTEATGQAPGPPPRAAGWMTTWYAFEEATATNARLATLDHTDVEVIFHRGQGACYEGDRVVFTAFVDVTAEHCRQWFPECQIPGICPLPPDWAAASDAGPVDAAASDADAPMTPSDAASSSDATVDASQSD